MKKIIMTYGDYQEDLKTHETIGFKHALAQVRKAVKERDAGDHYEAWMILFDLDTKDHEWIGPAIGLKDFSLAENEITKAEGQS